MARREKISESEKMTPKLAQQLIIDSFRLSQGDPELQVRLIRWMFKLNPKWRVDPHSPEYAEIHKHLNNPKTLDVVHTFRTGPSHPATYHPDFRTSPAELEETDKAWINSGVVPFMDCLVGNYDRPALSPREVFGELVSADLHFFGIKKRGEDQANFIRPNSLIADFFVPGTLRHGLCTRAFRMLCEVIGKRIVQLRLSEEEWDSLKMIQNRHNSSPSNTRVNILGAFRYPLRPGKPSDVA